MMHGHKNIKPLLLEKR